MGERLDLTVPETFTSPSPISYWELDGTYIRKAQALVKFYVVGSNGEERIVSISGLAATNYMKALNKRDASVKSNEKWTIERLQAAGKLAAGSISGAPD